RCCRSSTNDCATSWPESRSSHEKAQKTQRKLFEYFVSLRDLPNFEFGFEDIDGIRTDHHLKLARLDNISQLTIPKPELLRPKHELDATLLTGLQRHALKSFQLFYRTRHRRDEVTNVQLDHFIAGPLTCVLNLNTNRELSVRGDLRGAELRLTDLEMGVTKPVAKRIERRPRHVEVFRRVTVLGLRRTAR